MKPNETQICSGTPREINGKPYIGVEVAMTDAGKRLITWGEDEFLFHVDSHGEPRVTKIDENTRWRIYQAKDGQMIVELVEEESGGLR